MAETIEQIEQDRIQQMYEERLKNQRQEYEERLANAEHDFNARIIAERERLVREKEERIELQNAEYLKMIGEGFIKYLNKNAKNKYKKNQHMNNQKV